MTLVATFTSCTIPHYPYTPPYFFCWHSIAQICANGHQQKEYGKSISATRPVSALQRIWSEQSLKTLYSTCLIVWSTDETMLKSCKFQTLNSKHIFSFKAWLSSESGSEHVLVRIDQSNLKDRTGNFCSCTVPQLCAVNDDIFWSKI
jgi:hypothetical protein